jgi:3-methylcrotonyl-CoA carboxylase alpha subunit
MEYTLSINKENLKITLPAADEALIGEKRFAFSGRFVSENELLMTIDGRQFPACLVDVGGETQLFLKGRTYAIEDTGDADRRPKRRGGPGDLEQKITPPMPSVVIRLLVAEGDVVKKKQPLIVLSAMKMETTLGAPYDGTVKKVNAAAGDQVMPGLLLVEIEKAPEEEHGN